MKLSIITINYNNAEGLRKTMESVFSQSYRDFEYIVVDGASTDESVDVIREYESDNSLNAHPISFRWISEPDNGIYNAMNKGIKMAHGEYVLMLNSADFLVHSSVIEHIIYELHTDDIIQGNIIEDYPDGSVRNRGYGRSNISFFDVLNAYFPHQAIFIRIEIMELYGFYDETYAKASDSYFIITALGLHNATFRYIDIDITNFDQHGISHDPQWAQIDKEEDARWYKEHIPHRILDIYNSVPPKIRLYDQLHKHKIIWLLTMVLIRISEFISPISPKIKIEKLNNT